jgi:hypothetical protein
MREYPEHSSHVKIGSTLQSARARSNSLPEKERIDLDRSYGWRMATEYLARSTEQILHSMLRHFEFQRPRIRGQAGFTEWYSHEAEEFVENFMNNIRGTWFERVSFKSDSDTQLKRLIAGLRLSLREGSIALEGRDELLFYVRINAASRAINMLFGNHKFQIPNQDELEIVDCFEPLNGDTSYYAGILCPRLPNYNPFNLEFDQLCNLIPPYTGGDCYFTFEATE